MRKSIAVLLILLAGLNARSEQITAEQIEQAIAEQTETHEILVSQLESENEK